MKCSQCEKEVPFNASRCPFCGKRIPATVFQAAPIARFWSSSLRIGPLDIIWHKLFLVLLINVCVLSFALNGIMVYGMSIPTVWCPYVVCVSILVYVLLKGFATHQMMSLPYLRRHIYFLMISVSSADFAYRSNFRGCVYIYSGSLIILGIIALVCLLTKKTTHGSFGVTMAFNTLFSAVPIVFHRLLDEVQSSRSMMVAYAAFGLSSLMLVNFLLLFFAFVSSGSGREQ